MTSPSTSAPATPAVAPGRRPPPTWAVVAGVVVLVALLGLASPAVGRQLGLSATRQTATWTELYFTGGAAAPASGASCGDVVGQVRTRFTLVSHEDRTRTVDYRVEVVPERSAATAAVVREGSRTLAPGETARVSAALPASSSGAQRVVVTLPDTGAEITTRCAGSDS